MPGPHTAEFRFYAELADFLPESRRGRPFAHSFRGSPAVKDVVEALGVPHTEVDLILVNGQSVGFGHRLRDGDRVSVYPVFETLDVTALSRLRPRPLREPRFVLDTHLGRLATYMRLLGYDTLYTHAADDKELARVSHEQGRILLSRDRGLLKRRVVTHGHWVRSDKPPDQVVEVMRRFDLTGAARPFTRCLRCNALVVPVTKAEVLDRLEPRTKLYYDRFGRCPACGRVYWQGSHYERMRRLVDRVLAAASAVEER
jgi:uncharacterized protein with PIN domain